MQDLISSLSNHGRFGPADERGTLNLLTAEGVRRATATITDGETFDCARPLKPGSLSRSALSQEVLRTGAEAATPFGGTSDAIRIACHGFEVTHIDALCHIALDGSLYNGFPRESVDESGAEHCSVSSLGGSIVCRAVLFDLPALRGVGWLDPHDPILPAELREAARRQGVELEPGDAMIVYTGREAREASMDGLDPWRDGLAGLHVDCLDLIRHRDVALLGCDGVSDAIPSPVADWALPVHAIAIAAMGLPLVDNMLLSDLAEACRDRSRYEFMLVVAPLPLHRATGSAVNPVAIL